MATPWLRDEHINVYIFNQPGCRWRAVPGISPRQRTATDSRMRLHPSQRSRRVAGVTLAFASGMTRTGLQAFLPPVSGNDLLRWEARLRAVQCPASLSAGWPSPDALLLRPVWLVVVDNRLLPPARLFRRRPCDFPAPLPLFVQPFKQSRNRAGLIGMPTAFSSSTSWALLQPL